MHLFLIQKKQWMSIQTLSICATLLAFAGCSSDPNAALLKASKEGDLSGVKRIIDRVSDLNIKDERGFTPLIWACINSNSDIAVLLIEKGADVDLVYPESNGNTALHKASEMGLNLVVKKLIEKGANKNALNHAKQTALFLAVLKYNAEELIKVLLDAKIDVNAKDDYGSTALIEAAWFSNEKVVKMLLDNGADINANGGMALSQAAGSGKTKTVELLIERGADILWTNRNGETFLNQAASNGKVHTIRRLIEMGFDVNSASKYGDTLLMDSVKEHGELALTKLLIEKGANVNARNHIGYTALSFAAINGKMDEINLLIEKGADINTRDYRGYSPLNLSMSKRDNGKMFDFLLYKGADVNSEDNDKTTILMHAAGEGRYEFVKKLVEKGADVNARNSSGMTPLKCADFAGNKKKDIIEILKKAGARQK